jgi:transposase
MFVRTITRRQGAKTYEYLYLVEGHRVGGRVQQRVVSPIGRADLLAPHLDKLLTLLRPYTRERILRAGEISAAHGLTYGPLVVARRLWEQLGIGAIIGRHCPTRDGLDVAETAFMLTAHRLLHPGSEHALAWWLEESWVADRAGQRVLPQWEAHGRVRVAYRQLRQWYHTLDHLIAAKEAIETDLYLQLRDLFGLQVEVVFYDLTSTYFEGTGPTRVARCGHSRDGRPRNRQVLVGVVMASGWPIASYVFAGNRGDRQTVKAVLANVRRRFTLQRVVWVCDRGMVSDQALQALVDGEDRYLVGIQRRRNPTAQAVLAAARKAPGQPLPDGGRAIEVQLPNDPIRYIVVHSPERLGFERAMRRQDMTRCRDALRKLHAAVAVGRLKTPEKIGARAGTVLRAHHGYRYFTWRLGSSGQFVFTIDRAKLRAERRVEGTYLLQTNDRALDTVQTVAAYKELLMVERAFRELKGLMEMRPIYHQTQARVRAHLFVAHLALLLGCALHKALTRTKLTLALDTALEALRPIRLVELDVAGQHLRLVTRPGPHGQAVLRAVGIHQLTPPGERCGKQKSEIQENQGV